MNQPWFLYIVKCKDNTFYTGVTTNVKERIKKHNNGTGAKYTRARGPVELLICEKYENRSKAQIEESRIKKLTRKQKEEFVSEKMLEKFNER